MVTSASQGVTVREGRVSHGVSMALVIASWIVPVLCLAAGMLGNAWI